MKNIEAIAQKLDLKHSSPLDIKPGELYLAHKNNGPQILTCKKNEVSFIVPVEHAYCYDMCDCVKLNEG